MGGVHRHDVGMLETGQFLGLALEIGRKLQCDQAIGQLALTGQENASE